MPFRYRDQAATQQATIRVQWALVVGLLLLLYVVAIGWHRASQDLTLHVPPDLSGGATLQPGQVMPHNAYVFTARIWQNLYHWPQDGETDYAEKIAALSAYFTPAMQAYLLEDLQRRGKRGDLRNRARGLQEVPGAGYNATRVVSDGAGQWTVYLDLEVRDYFEGTVVDAKFVRYPLRLVRYAVQPGVNPWGLAIDGFADQPRELTAEELAEIGLGGES